MGEQILKIKQEHPDWGYKRIALVVGCSPNTVKYHLHPTNKSDIKNRTRRYRNKNPLLGKLSHFRDGLRKRKYEFNRIAEDRNVSAGNRFTLKDLMSKFQTNPICYLTGRKIDLQDTRSYHFDHIVPVARGGSNTLDNLGLLCADANRAKSDKTPEEFLALCREVLRYHEIKTT